MMEASKEDAKLDEALSHAALRQLGEAHLSIVRSARKMNHALYTQSKDERGIITPGRTDFGRLVAGDEIAWWAREMVADLDLLKTKVASARLALQKLLEDAKTLQARDAPATYLELLESVVGLCTSNATQITAFFEYVKWLEARDALGPSILFTYKVWGSTRLAEREFGDDPVMSDEDQLRICIEWATGLRTRASSVRHKVTMDVSAEIADSIDPETYSGPIHVSYERIRYRLASAIRGNLVIYFEYLRNSCRDLEIEITKAEELLALLDSEAFWQAFVEAVVTTHRTEETWWDLKQTLEMWHTAGDVKREKEQNFNERVAAFANTEGGVLVIGVSDAPPRSIVGVPDPENKITHIFRSIASHTDLAQSGIRVREVLLRDTTGTSHACLIVAVAKSPDPISTEDHAGRLSYPVRRGPGIVRSTPTAIAASKQHQKGFDWEFMNHIRAIAR